MRPNEKATVQKIETEILTPYAPAVLSKDSNCNAMRLIQRHNAVQSHDFDRAFNSQGTPEKTSIPTRVARTTTDVTS
jgi:hypothetical protein